MELKLNPDQLNAAQGSPLAIAQSSVLLQPAVLATPPLLAEAPNGAFLRADSFVFRLNPGESASILCHATQFGLRYAKQQISLSYRPSVTEGQILRKKRSDETLVRFAVRHVPHDGRYARLQIPASDPGNPRLYIDGQIYGVTYQLGTRPPPIGSVQNGSQFLSALVFSVHDIPAQPNPSSMSGRFSSNTPISIR